MPGATPGQKQNNLSNIERLNKIVPFNVDDTLNILKANRKPLGKKMEQLVMQPQIVPNVDMQPQSIEQDAIRRTGSYDPQTYNYGYENGKFFREKKQ
jgi:hypothetical protein